MKKIINGRKYDTGTAEKLGERSYSYRGDFNFVSEELYRKKTGEFFLYGEGGGMTQYASRVDSNCWTGGEDIIPLTEKEAKEWAERFLDADEYEAIFGEVQE